MVTEQLTQRYRELWEQKSEIEREMNEIKEILNTMYADRDFEDENIKLKHFSTLRADYKKFIEDNGIVVPDDYIIEKESSRITVKKNQEVE